MKTVGSGPMVHEKSSDLELLNAEETVFLATTVLLILSFVLPSRVSQYTRQYETLDVAYDIPVDSWLKVAYSKVPSACS